MSIWSFITMFFKFIRELLFDSKEELDYQSTKFDARKMSIFFIIITLVLAVVLLTNRLFNQSVYVVQLKDAVIYHQLKDKKQKSIDRKELLSLRAYVDSLPDKVKKSYPVPSDSENIVEKILPIDPRAVTPFDEPVVIPIVKQPVLTRSERDVILKDFLIKDDKP